MRGINRITGKELDGIPHIQQSIRDILTTKIGTRVMRRDYGSRLPELVDHPINEATKIELFAATAEALVRWEPRFRLDRVYLTAAGDQGKIILTLEGRIRATEQVVRFEGIEIT